jgi:F0F1-type ATP synthase epsilon subunit
LKKAEDKKYATVTIIAEDLETLREIAAQERRSMLQQLSLIINKVKQERHRQWAKEHMKALKLDES